MSQSKQGQFTGMLLIIHVQYSEKGASIHRRLFILDFVTIFPKYFNEIAKNAKHMPMEDCVWTI